MICIETEILKQLMNDEPYCRKVIPFLKPEYFPDKVDRVIFTEINSFVEKYNNLPTKEAVVIALNRRDDMSDEEYKKATELMDVLNEDRDEAIEDQWMIDETEIFCVGRSVNNAIMESITILEGNDKQGRTSAALPEILRKALSVTFDAHVGHDYIDDAESRYDFYQLKESRLPFDLRKMNEITGGGLVPKSLTIIMAGTGVGKSTAMVHFAAANLSLGKNVIYITCEMAEERIAERIDANLMNITVDSIQRLRKDEYGKKINHIASNTPGKLVIKEYPTAVGTAAHFRSLIDELKMKKNFTPDIIYVDYLNICGSSRQTLSNSNSYGYVKSIAEELRGLAQEVGVPLVTATQTNRGGFNDTDVSLTNTSESFGVPFTADLMFALISTEELEAAGQIMVKQLKNRYQDANSPSRFLLGLDRSKMQLSDLSEAESSVDGVLDGSQLSNNQAAPSSKFSDFKLS